MAKPTNLIEWATAGGATLEPSPTQKTAGFALDDVPPARWINWLFNGAHTWFQYVSNLHGETEFLNKVYAWTAAHTFAAGATVSGGDLSVQLGSVYTPLLVGRAVSSAATALVVENAGRIRIDDGIVSAPVGYYSGTLALSPAQMSGGGTNYDGASGLRTVTGSGSGGKCPTICLNGLLPKNAFIQRVYMAVTKGGTQSTSLEVVRRNPTTGAVDPLDAAASSTAGSQLLDTGIIASANRQMIDPATYTWEIFYVPGTSDADAIAAIHVDYRLPEIGKPS